jgi:hypothetical protein
MAILLQGPPYIIPRSVIANIQRDIAPLASQRLRALITPYSILGLGLVERGLLNDLDVIGVLDANSARKSMATRNSPVYDHDELPSLDVDVVVITSIKFHREIEATLSKKLKPGTRIINLLHDYNLGLHRQELATRIQALSWFNQLLELSPYNIPIGTPITLGFAKDNAVQISIPDHWGLGDKLCALSTAREYARRNPNLKVHFCLLPEIVEAFGDQLISPEDRGIAVPNNSDVFHREKHHSIAGNYLGCYYLGFGLEFASLPALELPRLPPPDGLASGSYVVLQPAANWAQPNLSTAQLQTLVDASPLPVIVSGRNETSRELRNVSYDYLGNELDMLRLVQHARLAITPRSATIHIAAAYRIPTVAWLPDDGENWHLDYPDWVLDGVVMSAADLESHVADVRSRLIAKLSSSQSA